MDDLDIARRISALSDEEHALERSHTGQALSDDELARRGAIEVALDQMLGPHPATTSATRRWR